MPQFDSLAWPCWHRLEMPHGTVEALVLVLCAPGKRATATRFARRWAPVVPHSAFAGLEVEPAYAEATFARLRALIALEVANLGLGANQLILVGAGEMGQCALNLAVLGVVPGVSAIVIDIPPGTIPMGAPTVRAFLRFVQSRQGSHLDRLFFDKMIQVLRSASFDVRSVVLSDGPDPAQRAVGGFLVELVANAGHYRSGPAL